MAGDPSDAEVPDGVESASRPGPAVGLGPALRRAWLGYQNRLDEAMTSAGFEDRKFPDGRILRLCSDPAGSTISGIGREIGMTRQGAGKVVNHLRDRGYVSVGESATSGREKTVTITPLGSRYLAAQRIAARAIEDQLRTEMGEEVWASLHLLVEVLDQGDDVRMRTYLGSESIDSGDRQQFGSE